MTVRKDSVQTKGVLAFLFLLAAIRPAVIEAGGVSVQRGPASRICPALAASSTDFDVLRFLEKVDRFRLSPPSRDEVESALSQPEDLLAVIECLAHQEYQSKLQWTKLIQEMEPSELAKLSSILKSFPKSRQAHRIEDSDLERFVVELYRVMHRPRAFWKNVWTQKSFRRALDSIDDQEISERIFQGSLKQGLFPVLTEVIPFQERRAWSQLNAANVIRAMGYFFGSALWITSVYVSSQDIKEFGFTWSNVIALVPAALPMMFHKYLFRSKTENKMEVLVLKGIDDAVEVEHVRRRLKEQIQSRRGTQVLKRAVLLLTSIAISVVWSEAIADVGSRQLFKLAMPDLSKISELADYAQMGPEEQVEFRIKEIQRAMKQDGQKPMDEATLAALRQMLLESKSQGKE